MPPDVIDDQFHVPATKELILLLSNRGNSSNQKKNTSQRSIKFGFISNPSTRCTSGHGQTGRNDSSDARNRRPDQRERSVRYQRRIRYIQLKHKSLDARK